MSFRVMDRMDNTMESKYPVRSTLSYCPSCPTVHPVHDTIGQTVYFEGKLLSTHLKIQDVLFRTVDSDGKRGGLIRIISLIMIQLTNHLK